MEDFAQRMSSLGRNVFAGSAAPEREASPALSVSPSGEGEPMEDEEPEGPLFPLGAIPLGDQLGDIAVTELSEMKAVRALIRQLVPTGLCPPPPFVSRPQNSALFVFLDEPEAPAFVAARGLDELPPSFSTEKAGRLMDAALRDAERQGEGHQRSAVPTLPSSGPAAWLQSGKRFTSALPQVEGYRSDYYRSTAQGANAAVSLQVLCEDHQLQELVPAKALATASVKEAKLDKALAKDKECQSTLSYAEHTLFAPESCNCQEVALKS
jgi:hypothetical protein